MKDFLILVGITTIGLICYTFVMIDIIKTKKENNKTLEQGLENCCKSLENLNHTLKEVNKELDEMYRKFKRSNKRQNKALNSYFNN